MSQLTVGRKLLIGVAGMLAALLILAVTSLVVMRSLSQNLTLGDIVMTRVYIGGDPTKDFRGDALETRAAFRQFFGTADQPNKPACTTVHVVLPAAPRGVLVEIDAIAVRPKSLPGVPDAR